MATRKPPARPVRSRAKTTAKSRKARPARKTAVARPAKKPRRDPETLRLRATNAGFTVADLQRSLTFYTDALGFIVGELWSDDKGHVQGATLKAGSCEIVLSQDDWSKGRDRAKGEGVRVWCETAQDPDGLARRIKAAGFRLSQEPHDEPWGARSFSVDDPDGFHLTMFREK
jgi:lactoylglutathione lyase